jgi:hypothetical protein
MRSGLGLTLKIGGCESVRDMLEARSVGVERLVAPMIESAYALRKYLQAVKKVFSDDHENLEIMCNIETCAAMDIIGEILSIPEIDRLDGIVIERIDLCNSAEIDEDSINTGKVSKMVQKGFSTAMNKGKSCTIGGGVSAETIDLLKTLQPRKMLRYETRKVTFNAEKALDTQSEKGILKALGFELLWLKNKLSYYKSINKADLSRISLIEHNYQTAIDAML